MVGRWWVGIHVRANMAKLPAVRRVSSLVRAAADPICLMCLSLCGHKTRLPKEESCLLPVVWPPSEEFFRMWQLLLKHVCWLHAAA